MPRYSLLASRSRLIGAALLSLMLGPSPALAQPAPLVMKLGTATLNDTQHEWMRRFVAAVEKESGGRIKGEIYPASQLGAIPRMIEGTQFGSIQGYIGPPEFLAGVDARFEVLSAPGLFKDLAHANRVLQDPGFADAFLAVGEAKGLKGIGLFVSGPIAFNTRRKIAAPDELKGMKVRVLAAPLQMEQMRQLGATPVPMALGEVLPALQQGALDGVMSTLQVLAPLRYYDAAKYIIESDHAIVSVITVVNKDWYDKLAPDLKKIVGDSGRKVSAEVFPWTIEHIARQRAVWTEKGGELTALPPPAQQAFNQRMAAIGPAMLKDKPESQKLYDLLVAAAKKSQ